MDPHPRRVDSGRIGGRSMDGNRMDWLETRASAGSTGSGSGDGGRATPSAAFATGFNSYPVLQRMGSLEHNALTEHARRSVEYWRPASEQQLRKVRSSLDLVPEVPSGGSALPNAVRLFVLLLVVGVGLMLLQWTATPPEAYRFEEAHVEGRPAELVAIADMHGDYEVLRPPGRPPRPRARPAPPAHARVLNTHRPNPHSRWLTARSARGRRCASRASSSSSPRLGW